MYQFLFRAAVVAGIVVACGARNASGGVRPLEQSVHVAPSAGFATFTLFFDHTPDFDALDANGHPVDSFQVEVNGAWQPGGQSMGQITSVIRGDEIHFDNMLPIRAAAPADTAPRAGGWGAIVDSVPFTLVGNELSFTTSLQTLGTSSGVFAYRAFLLEHGQITAEAQAQSVPLPSAEVAGIPVILVLALWLLAGRNVTRPL